MTEAVSLREYVEQIITQQEKRNLERIRALEAQVASLERLMQSRMSASDKAIEKAEQALRAKLEIMNEFRNAMKDLSATFVPRRTIDQQNEDFARRLGNMETWKSGIEGRIIGWSGGFAAVVLLIAIVTQLVGLGS